MSSSSYPTIKDPQWALYEIRSGEMNLESISFKQSNSPPSSFQETESSMSINISIDNNDSVKYFCQVLSALLEKKNSMQSLSNLAFHGLKWENEKLQSLSLLLDGSNSSIRQLEFQRNMFSMEGLLGLSKILERNTTLRVAIISECHIGFVGAKLLASALAKNEKLEELQLWEDSIGSKGAEELSRIIEMNSTLKLLLILDKDYITATPIISAVIARSRAMEVHIWSKDNCERSSKVVEFTPETSTLRIYKLNPSGCQRVACALGYNTTVNILDMTGIRLKLKWAKEFRGVLEQNKSLRDVILSRTLLEDKSVAYVAAGLFKNKFLQNLRLDGNWFSGIGVEHLLCPLSRFSAFQNQANTTLKSVTFGGGKTKIGRDGIVAILRMLETNQTIHQFGIYDDNSMKPDDIVRIFKSLERSATLRCLSLKSCKGVQGELVLQTIMETLQVNPWIEEIDLSGTPLQISGKADSIYEKLGKNGSLLPENDVLDQDLPTTMPACCRIFLCGQEFAGKTTLCNSVHHHLNSTKFPYMDQIRTLVNPVEQIARTSEIKIKTVHDGDTKISIWNLAGQHENFALHDIMFPGHGSPSLFLIVSSLFRKPANREAKSPEEIEADLLYWLKFVVSNSRKAHLQSVLPHITIVLTHSDKVARLSQNFHPAVHSIQRLKERFQGCIELYPTVYMVDARSSVSVSNLVHHLRKTSKTILHRVPRVYQLCNDLIKIFEEWRSRNYNKPAMRWSEFSQLCQLKVPALRIKSRRDNTEKVEMWKHAVLKSLHHVGEIIFFEELGFLILDCNWFCGEVLGQLMKLGSGNVPEDDKDNGFVRKKQLENLLKSKFGKEFDNLETSDLIAMMLKLELCYEQDPQDPNTLLLIPAILEEGRGKLPKWELSTSKCVYVGRHLECELTHTFLTTGFFPRLQVHLRNKIFNLKDQHGATYSLEKNLISIIINGIHLRIEVGAPHGDYVDVLACSTKSVTEILKLFQQLIMPTIQKLSVGITMTEYIIRPACVKNLIPPSLRRSQIVALQRLKHALLSMPADNMYDYQHTWSSLLNRTRPILQAGFDYARDLLSDDDFREVLHRRCYDLHNLAIELAAPFPFDESIENPPPMLKNDVVEPSLSGIAKGVEMVLQRLKIIEQDIKDLKQEIQGIRHYEHRLLIELHRKVDYMVNYNIQLEECKVPQMFYFVQVQDNYTKRLVTRILAGMTSLRLHMLCEFRREMHVVDDQIGCELMHIDNQTVKYLLPYMSKFMKLLTFSLKIGAHFAAGLGEMIPDLGREVAHLMDSSLIYGTEAMATGILGAATIGQLVGRSKNTNLNGGLRNGAQDHVKSARQWVVDFLKGQRVSTGKDIAERFGLWRVRYIDDGQIAWICRRHKETRGHEIIEVPI